MSNKSFLQILAVIFIMGCSKSPLAAPTPYTDITAFNTAITGYSKSTLDFDGLGANSLIADGSTLVGITFNYPTLAGFGVSLQVRNDGDTTSAPHFLGTDDGGVLEDGDDINLEFNATNAIGMYLLSLDEMFDNDIRLQVNGTIADLIAADLVQTLTDGTNVYFLGIVDEDATFSSVNILTSHDDVVTGGGLFFWNVDDIVTAEAPSTPSGGVPEPHVLFLFGVGLIGFVIVSQQRKETNHSKIASWLSCLDLSQKCCHRPV